MAETQDISAWILLFVGLYSLAASIGELRLPGFWAKMLADFERYPGLRFLTGFFVLSLGAAIYLVNPWRPDDWMAVLVSVLGGAMVAEGMLILAMGDRLLGFARALMGRSNAFWTGFSAIFGIAAIAVALARLQ
jgi:hypothetical protein